MKEPNNRPKLREINNDDDNNNELKDLGDGPKQKDLDDNGRKLKLELDKEGHKLEKKMLMS